MVKTTPSKTFRANQYQQSDRQLRQTRFHPADTKTRPEAASEAELQSPQCPPEVGSTGESVLTDTSCKHVHILTTC